MVLIISSSFGLVWGIVYLIFSLMHSMTEMFNEKFLFLVAGILDVNPDTFTAGLTFAFLDGTMVGFLLGIILVIIYKRNTKR